MAVPKMELSYIISTEHVHRQLPLLYRHLGACLPHFDPATVVLMPQQPYRYASWVGAVSIATIDADLIGAPFSTVSELCTPKVTSFP